MESQTFTCTDCGGTFDKGRPDAEAEAEVLAVFGMAHQPDDAVLCDDCYKALMSADDNDRAALARQLLKRLNHGSELLAACTQLRKLDR